MKPISLEMHAFGPYGDRADVDFEPLADVGLFVVSGPTGAGKSTIFDAICFALYGSLSGSRSSHSDVRSHYAEPHAKCTVVLVFDAEGQRWRITRQPSQTVQKQRGTGTTVQPATAVLDRWTDSGWHPDTVKVRDVTSRCRELVGLSLEQFERVVLLPQGKFAEVLNAKTSERSELLRTLFGSEIFDRAAKILGEQAKEGEQSLQGVNEQRSYFHGRAVEAIERIEAAIAELPEEMALASADEPMRTIGSQTQLSFLDEPTEVVVDLTDVPQELGPVADLDALVSGPVACLFDLAEQRRLAAEAARTERDRAEAQRRAIDQRAETLRLLALLEAQSDDMANVAARTSVGQKLVGLQAAIDERRSQHEQLERVELAMSKLWATSQRLLPSALPGEAATAGEERKAPTPAVVSDVLDRIAARSAALDLVAEERQRLEQLRRERASLGDRSKHLEAIDQRALVASEASLVEGSALAEEEELCQTKAAASATLEHKIAAQDKLLALRRQADGAAEKSGQLTDELAKATSGVEAAQTAITAADAEIATLSIAADELEVRGLAATQAKRRCERRADVDAAAEQLTNATAHVEQAKAVAEEAFAAFVGQTAPRLAAQLIDDEPCPVCGSCEHPAPAGDGHDRAQRPVDAAAVEQASAAASAADAELSRWRTTVTNLIEDDPELATAELAELQAVQRQAESERAGAEQALLARDQLMAGRAQLQDRLLETQDSVAQITDALAKVQLDMREVEGALGEAADQTRDQLDQQRQLLLTQRADAVAAAERLVQIKARREEIAHATAEAERLSRQRSIDRATAAERIGQLTATIAASEEQLESVLDGEELSVRREVVQSVRLALAGWQDEAIVRARVGAAKDVSEARCASLVAAAGFADEAEAVAASLPSATLEQLEASHGRWSHELAAHRAALATFEVQELPDEAPDLEALTAAALAAAEQQREASHALNTIQHSVQTAQADLAEVAALDEAHAHKRAEHETLQRVASVVRGQNSRRLSLENWVLSVYLHDVVEHANLHLATMSNGRYRLAVQDAPSSQVGQHGLDLVVDDAHTGRVRSSMSLSGGETFQASLALALGLADVVMLGRAGLHLDALFVDEGFGSLDADAIDQAITVLDGLRSRGSMVGVITHVEALKNALPVAIDVQPRSDHRGSQIRQVA